MRNEEEMFNLILDFAKMNNSIKAVLLNGSRANPNTKKDKFMDFDIVYVVDRTEPFIKNEDFISYFGEILIMQEPDNPNLFVPEYPNEEKYTYLMQFTDGNRIDLTFAVPKFAEKICKEDSQTVVLIDKNNIFSEISSPSDKSYHIKRPSENEFLACCNEFWWLSIYIAKGLWRNQVVYAIEIFNQDVHPEFMKMMRLFVGINNEFNVSIGKYDKYFKELLPSEVYDKVLKTYPTANIENIWTSLKMMCNLFDKFSNKVSIALGFKYDSLQCKDIMDYIFGGENSA